MTTEEYYLIVRAVAALYLFYRLWHWLFRGYAVKLWSKILTPRTKSITKKPVSEPINVIGRSKTVYLEDPLQSRIVPIFSQYLEPTGYIGQEDDILPDDVETNYPPSIPSDEDLYEDDDGLPPDPGLSTGLSFERISEAVGVLTEPDCDEEKKSRAAQTFDDLRNTQILECITREVCNLSAIEKLIKEHLDPNGEPRRQNTDIKDFSILNYV